MLIIFKLNKTSLKYAIIKIKIKIGEKLGLLKYLFYSNLKNNYCKVACYCQTVCMECDYNEYFE